MATKRFYFPQDEIWNNASQIELKLLKADGYWYLSYEVSGTIGRDPFDDDEEDDDEDGGLLEPKEQPDPEAVVASIVGDLMKRNTKRPAQ